MSANVYFKKVSDVVMGNLQEAGKDIFAYAYESKRITKLLQEVHKIINGDTFTDEEVEEAKKAEVILTTQRTRMGEWYKAVSASYDSKFELDAIIAKCDVITSYETAVSNVAKILTRVFGLEECKKGAVSKFAKKVVYAISGYNPATATGVIKGELVRGRSVRQLKEVAVRTMIDYASKTTDNVWIHTAEFYKVAVEYEKDITAVKSVKVEEV